MRQSWDWREQKKEREKKRGTVTIPDMSCDLRQPHSFRAPPLITTHLHTICTVFAHTAYAAPPPTPHLIPNSTSERGKCWSCTLESASVPPDRRAAAFPADSCAFLLTTVTPAAASGPALLSPSHVQTAWHFEKRRNILLLCCMYTACESVCQVMTRPEMFLAWSLSVKTSSPGGQTAVAFLLLLWKYHILAVAAAGLSVHPLTFSTHVEVLSQHPSWCTGRVTSWTNDHWHSNTTTHTPANNEELPIYLICMFLESGRKW